MNAKKILRKLKIVPVVMMLVFGISSVSTAAGPYGYTGYDDPALAAAGYGGNLVFMQYVQVDHIGESRNAMTLWNAMTMFNQPDIYQRARAHIDFKDGLGNIALIQEVSLVNELQSDLFCDIFVDECFVFGPRLDIPDDQDKITYIQDKRAKFSVSTRRYEQTENLPEGVIDRFCSIRVKNGPAVLQNFSLNVNNTRKCNGGNDDAAVEGEEEVSSSCAYVDGVCFEGSKVIFNNVHVSQSRGSALVVGPNVSSVEFEGPLNMVQTSEVGIELMGSENLIRTIDFNGITFEHNYKYMIQTPVSANINSDEICVTEDFFGEEKGWNLIGQVKDCDDSMYENVDGEVGPKDESCTSPKPENPSAGMMVYYMNANGKTYRVPFFSQDDGGYIEIQKALGDFYSEGQFSFRIGETDLKRAVARVETGIDVNETDATKKQQLDTAIAAVEISEEAPRLFFMALKGSGFGSSSSVIAMEYNPTACGGDVDIDSDIIKSDGLSKKLKFVDEGECHDANTVHYTNVGFDFELDTDSDKLSDQVEMRLSYDNDGNVYIGASTCYTEKAVSRWNSADSDGDGDGDGVPDGKELLCWNGDSITSDTAQKGIVDHGVLCGCKIDPVTKKVNWSVKDGKCNDPVSADHLSAIGYGADKNADGCNMIIMDTDNDCVPNVRDTDSDGDNTEDWKEDRAKLYKGATRKAYYYKVGGTPYTEPYAMPGNGDNAPRSGKPTVCYDPSSGVNRTDDQDIMRPYDPTKGITYGIFAVPYKAIDSTDPESHAPIPLSRSVTKSLEAAGIDYDIVTLACKSTGLIARSNFNGELDGSDCSNLQDSTDNGKCRKNCYRNEILEVISDADGAYINVTHTSLVNSDGGRYPDLFQKVIEGELDPDELISICEDADEDGIPNCVEAAVALNDYVNIGTCSDGYREDGDPTGTSYEYALSPYQEDSDGDDKGDGWDSDLTFDKCPNDFAPVGAEDECDEYDIYEKHPILAFYLDRDGDGLRDVLEFCPVVDGIRETAWHLCYAEMVSVASYGRTDPSRGHSDPFSDMSDTDQLSDLLEWVHGTNPSQNDSDRDGLDDDVEVSYDGDSGSSSAKNSSSEESWGVGIDETLTCGEQMDTDPMNEDTDHDGITDGIEVNTIGTSPNNPDSDRDTLCDGKILVTGYCEGGVELFNIPQEIPADLEEWWSYLESNPCSANTDGDEEPANAQSPDNAEMYGCRSNPLPGCNGLTYEEAFALSQGNNSGRGVGCRAYGNDDDQDGLPDALEIKYADELGTIVGEMDSDHDNLPDGCVGGKGELCNAIERGNCQNLTEFFYNCSDDFMDCDTHPGMADSDGDGLRDDKERNYGDPLGDKTPSNPWTTDTDGDCQPDGVEDADHDGTWDPDETRAASRYTTEIISGTNKTLMFEAVDTDQDGIPDSPTVALGGFGFEKPREYCLISGCWPVDMDGNYIGTNACDADSDHDGVNDWDEMFAGGHGFDLANLPYALHGRRGGCSMIAEGGSVDWTLIVVLGVLMIFAGVVRRRFYGRAPVEK